MLDQITPIILTYNEQENIGRTLSALRWAAKVFVIDSGSNDETLSICQQFANVIVVHREFDNHANQSNFALSQKIITPWVLSMDADYIVSTDLAAELSKLKPTQPVNGYRVSFDYLINGKRLNGTLYPPRLCLYKHDCAHYVQDGHTQRVEVRGEVSQLKSKMEHDDRKPFNRWIHSQLNYAALEAGKLATNKWQNLSLSDKLRKTAIAPLIILPYTLFIKGLIVNGWPGVVYSGQRFIAELVLQHARVKRFLS